MNMFQSGFLETKAKAEISFLSVCSLVVYWMFCSEATSAPTQYPVQVYTCVQAKAGSETTIFRRKEKRKLFWHVCDGKFRQEGIWCF